MNKRLQFFETEPIIAAVKTEEQLERALTSGCNIIFFLFGNICNIPKLVGGRRAQHQAAHTEAREGDRSHNGAAGLRAGLAGAG